MADIGLRNFDLAIYFPQYFSDPIEYVLCAEESSYAFMCESIHTVIVVSKPNDSNSIDFQNWKVYVQRLICDCRVSIKSYEAASNTEIYNREDTLLRTRFPRSIKQEDAKKPVGFNQSDKFSPCSPIDNLKENKVPYN